MPRRPDGVAAPRTRTARPSRRRERAGHEHAVAHDRGARVGQRARAPRHTAGRGRWRGRASPIRTSSRSNGTDTTRNTVPSMRAMPSTRSRSAPAMTDSAVARPDGPPVGRRPASVRVAARSVSTMASESMRAATSSSSPANRRQPLLAERRVGVRPGLGRVRVDGGLQRRAFGQRRRLSLQLALAPGLDRRENPLARLEIRRDRLPDLIANADGDDDEDGDRAAARRSRR